jgi:hypothetical protein
MNAFQSASQILVEMRVWTERLAERKSNAPRDHCQFALLQSNLPNAGAQQRLARFVKS